MENDGRPTARKLLLSFFSRRTVLKHRLLIQWQGGFVVVQLRRVLRRVYIALFFLRLFSLETKGISNEDSKKREERESVFFSRRGSVPVGDTDGRVFCESSGVVLRARVISALIGGPGAYRSNVPTQFRSGNRNFFLDCALIGSRCDFLTRLNRRRDSRRGVGSSFALVLRASRGCIDTLRQIYTCQRDSFKVQVIVSPHTLYYS